MVYALAINPDPHIMRLSGNMKNTIREGLNRNFGSYNALPHITLLSFEAQEKNYLNILAEFKKVLAVITPFQLGFAGYGDFIAKKNCTFFVKPDDDSSDAIIERCQKIGSLFDKSVRRKYIDSWKMVVKKTPHMTLARELTEKEVAVCYDVTPTDFSESFFCKYFVIRKFNEQRGQFDILDTIELLGRDYMEGEQTRLF
ncbi:2'-5' RNA ligase family protein [Dyadobacter luteus]|jgi:2'-5' RNA ligase|uniref:2'-5' RNA ligase family protein n=1 Tax=Dyadobacter luteus TaxID=2259619 RepID=A0A3D8Y9F2_9BACT|nr:2'-5' RNA ligase family protein [Dyadobacter luteus]REA59530.1 2'-5' RNA ligase family protein [Dyadobacter luteus]